MSGYAGLSRLKKQKLEAAGSSGAVQALRMENDAPAVGPAAPTANSEMVEPEHCDRGLESAKFPFTRVGLSRRVSELTVFNARFYIRVRHIDEPA
jgi:hypothetical protein